jgi:drug/metabolite transporter (DMT)-like permease
MGGMERIGAAGRSLPVRGIAWGVLAVLAWAVYNVGAKVGAAQGFRAPDLTVLRFGVAGLIMLPMLLRMGLRDLGGLGWPRGLALLLTAGPLFGLCVNTGFVLAPLAHGVVLGPGFTMLAAAGLGWWVEGERPSVAQLSGTAILLLGLLVIAADGLGAGTGELVWLGDLSFAATGILWGTFTVLLRRWRVDAVHATAVVAVLSSVVLVPGYLALVEMPDLPAGAVAVQAFLQGALGGCLGVLAYGAAVSRLGAGRAALFPACVPALATLLAVPVLGLVPDGLQTAGIVLCTLGLVTGLGILGGRQLAAAATPIACPARP